MNEACFVLSPSIVAAGKHSYYRVIEPKALGYRLVTSDNGAYFILVAEVNGPF